MTTDARASIFDQAAKVAIETHVVSEFGVTKQIAFARGAVWALETLTPTPRQATLAAEKALGCELDQVEAFAPACIAHESEVTEFGHCPHASAVADEMLALLKP